MPTANRDPGWGLHCNLGSGTLAGPIRGIICALCSWIQYQVPKEDKPILGCHVHLQLPDSVSEQIWADFDTQCDADVIDSALAWRLKESHKIPWGAVDSIQDKSRQLHVCKYVEDLTAAQAAISEAS